MLAIAGAKDLQLSAGPHQSAIEGALESGGNPHITVRAMPGLHHFLQEADPGSPAESTRIAQTASPSVLELLSGWIADGGLSIVIENQLSTSARRRGREREGVHVDLAIPTLFTNI